MSLSCSCPDYDGDGWYFFGPNDYTTLQTKRRRRCCSCKSMIDLGATCAEFQRFRLPITDIEELIHGDEVQIASKWMCESCAGLYFSLDELGYCIGLGDDLRELVKEYAEQKQLEAEQNKKVSA